MNKIMLLLILLPLYPVNKTGINRSITENEITITASYNAIACSCAQWSESKPDAGDRDYFYLERQASNLLDADSLWQGDNLPLQVKVTGQFLKKKGLPKGKTAAKEKPAEARIFRYTAISIIKNGN